jgi:hypothetical protein
MVGGGPSFNDLLRAPFPLRVSHQLRAGSRKKREGTGHHCVGNASEIKSLGHPPLVAVEQPAEDFDDRRCENPTSQDSCRKDRVKNPTGHSFDAVRRHVHEECGSYDCAGGPGSRPFCGR